MAEAAAPAAADGVYVYSIVESADRRTFGKIGIGGRGDDVYDALRDVLERMKNKLEYGLKVDWDRDAVVREIEDSNEEIRRLRAEITSEQQRSTYFARMQLGRPVERALSERSDQYVRDIYDESARSSSRSTDRRATPSASSRSHAARPSVSRSSTVSSP